MQLTASSQFQHMTTGSGGMETLGTPQLCKWSRTGDPSPNSSHFHLRKLAAPCNSERGDHDQANKQTKLYSKRAAPWSHRNQLVAKNTCLEINVDIRISLHQAERLYRRTAKRNASVKRTSPNMSAKHLFRKRSSKIMVPRNFTKMCIYVFCVFMYCVYLCIFNKFLGVTKFLVINRVRQTLMFPVNK